MSAETRRLLGAFLLSALRDAEAYLAGEDAKPKAVEA